MLTFIKNKLVWFLTATGFLAVAFAAQPATDPIVDVATSTPIEVVERRTINSKHIDNGDGSFTARIGSMPIHYDKAGSLDDIELNPVDMGSYWAFEKAGHKLYVAKDFSANNLIRFDNKFNGADHTLYFEPKQLTWVNKKDLSDKVVFRTAQSVQGVLVGNTITYKDAFGTGLDYEIIMSFASIGKNLVINAKSNLELPPTTNHKLVLLSRFKGDTITLKKPSFVWDKTNYFETNGEADFTEDSGKKTIMRKASIWDSEDMREPITMFWTKKNGALWQGKVLPKSFLVSATYPVRTDTTIDTYDATNSKQVVNDGVGGTYNAAVTAASGNNVYTLSLASQNILHDSLIGGNWYIRRVDLQFDTSSIGTGNVVSASQLNIYSGTVTVDTDGYSVNFLNNTDNVSLTDPIVVSDYSDFETDSANKVGSETLTNLDVAANVSIDMTDHSWVNVTGTSRLGARISNEMAEQNGDTTSDPTNQNVWRVELGTDAPYLVVTYAAAAADTIPAQDIYWFQ